jgi:hypothetical protein
VAIVRRPRLTEHTPTNLPTYVPTYPRRMSPSLLIRTNPSGLSQCPRYLGSVWKNLDLSLFNTNAAEQPTVGNGALMALDLEFQTQLRRGRKPITHYPGHTGVHAPAHTSVPPYNTHFRQVYSAHFNPALVYDPLPPISPSCSNFEPWYGRFCLGSSNLSNSSIRVFKPHPERL